MPRGKRTVFTLTCPETGDRIGTVRFHKQDKNGKSWKEHAAKLQKYSPRIRKVVTPKLKEEKHSS